MYISTRGNMEKQTSAQAIAMGMVPSGGLFVPETIPQICWQELRNEDYAGLATKIMRLFLDDLPSEILEEAVKVYGDGRFEGANPAPLVDAGDCGILELWHGPTAAFKDMALQVLPYFLASSMKTIGLRSEVLILTATSGDTGKAALEGFKDVPGTKIAVFYPDGGVSPVQERQMITTGGSNTYVAAVKGNFDECQTAVKKMFSSSSLKEKLSRKNLVFSSANSINWGRLMPQIVYYFWAYLQAVDRREVNPGEKINIVVPTGNFGNILAAYYAKKMGLPIANLICASNKNNVLTDFFQSGIYNSKRPFHLTSSPSMDILISSNFERFLFEVSGRNPQKIKAWFSDLSSNGKFEVDRETLNSCRQNMVAGWASEEEVTGTIHRVYQNFDYLIDPHTAVGIKVYEDYRRKHGDDTYTIVTSTASPFKFAHHVFNALQEGASVDPWDALTSLSDLTGWEIPPGLKDLSLKAAQKVTRLSSAQLEEYLIREFSLDTCI
ncbi:MAG: Threonine synthase [Candidatus Dichloromethanomonas elyunquensis]|nr:MAG: Threonine synthase [Candidatus Dichloromethanomonas elyunquensis]